MELQHCIACSGVMVAPQSYANVASPTTSNARKIVLTNCMFVYVSRPGYSSQAQGHSKTLTICTIRRISVDKSPLHSQSRVSSRPMAVGRKTRNYAIVFANPPSCQRRSTDSKPMSVSRTTLCRRRGVWLQCLLMTIYQICWATTVAPGMLMTLALLCLAVAMSAPAQSPPSQRE